MGITLQKVDCSSRKRIKPHTKVNHSNALTLIKHKKVGLLYLSPTFKNVLMLSDKPQRSNTLWHWGASGYPSGLYSDDKRPRVHTLGNQRAQ